jgi:Bacterial Ig domain/Matrixin
MKYTSILFFFLATFLLIPQVSAQEITDLPHCGGYYIAPGRLPPEECNISPNFKSADNPVILFLNLEGGTITSGGDNPEEMTSWIPDYDSIEIPPFDHEPFLSDFLNTRKKVIDALVGWVRYYYAPFGITITARRPLDTTYQMMMVGGEASVITPNPGSMVGVSPFDCGDSSKSDVNFCFSDSLGTLDDIVTTIVHEAGHSFGLAHVDDVAAVMNPYVTRDPYWTAGTVPDGQACTGGTNQDSFEVLGDNLGLTPDLESPWVDFISPGDGALVPLSFKVTLTTGDEDSLGRYVTLFVDGTEQSEKTWPDFSWNFNSLEPGKHTLTAEVSDHGGNSSSTTISLTVSDTCNAEESCTDGKNGISEPCSKEGSCNLGICVTEVNGSESWCSAHCTPLTSSCAPGMDCVLHEDGYTYYCAVGPGPVELKTDSKDHLLGCSSKPGKKDHVFWPIMVFSLLGLAIFRKR